MRQFVHAHSLSDISHLLELLWNSPKCCQPSTGSGQLESYSLTPTPSLLAIHECKAWLCLGERCSSWVASPWCGPPYLAVKPTKSPFHLPWCGLLEWQIPLADQHQRPMPQWCVELWSLVCQTCPLTQGFVKAVHSLLCTICLHQKENKKRVNLVVPKLISLSWCRLDGPKGSLIIES